MLKTGLFRIRVATSSLASRAGKPSGSPRRSADDDSVGQPFEISVASHECRPEASRGGVDERVGHRQTVGQGQIGRLQGERFVHRRDRRPAKSRHRFHGALLADIAPDDLVHFVDFGGAYQQRFAPLDIRGEATRVRATGEVLDPAARIDQDQWRSFLSRSPLGLVPRAIPL